MKATVFALALFVALGTATVADDAVKGTVTVSKTAPDAVLLWDAGQRLNDLQQAHASAADTMKALELDGAKIITERASALSASTIELRVMYPKTNFGAQYGDPTMDQKEKLVVLSAKRADAVKDGATWAKAITGGKKPKTLKINVTGKLPTT